MRGHSLDDLHLFVLTAQYQSLTQAAAKIGMPLATLSRRIKKLEEQLNCRLIDRSAHHFALTTDGERYFQLSQPFITGLNNVKDLIELDREELTGQIKISAPINMTQVWLKQCIYDFAFKHPAIQINLQVQNEKIDLISEQVDVTFRVGDPIEPDWIARKLWQIPFSLCASTLYLEQHPPLTHPSELSKHRLLSISPSKVWQMYHQHSGDSFSVNVDSPFQSNDVLLIRGAAQQGLGIAWMPPYYVHDAQQQGHALVPVLPEWTGEAIDVFLMYRDKDKQPARVKAFIQHVFDWKAKLASSFMVTQSPDTSA